MSALAVLLTVLAYVVAGRLVWRLFRERRRVRREAERSLLYFEAQLAARERLEWHGPIHVRVQGVLDRHSPGARLERLLRHRKGNP